MRQTDGARAAQLLDVMRGIAAKSSESLGSHDARRIGDITDTLASEVTTFHSDPGSRPGNT